jgi:hypothetical protein
MRMHKKDRNTEDDAAEGPYHKGASCYFSYIQPNPGD